MTEKFEPTREELQASYPNKINCQLARALFPILSWGTYDRAAAHRWALKLIKANPQDGLELTKALVNFEYMVEGACENYCYDRKYRERHDRAYRAFADWRENTTPATEAA